MEKPQPSSHWPIVAVIFLIAIILFCVMRCSANHAEDVESDNVETNAKTNVENENENSNDNFTWVRSGLENIHNLDELFGVDDSEANKLKEQLAGEWETLVFIPDTSGAYTVNPDVVIAIDWGKHGFSPEDVPTVFPVTQEELDAAGSLKAILNNDGACELILNGQPSTSGSWQVTGNDSFEIVFPDSSEPMKGKVYDDGTIAIFFYGENTPPCFLLRRSDGQGLSIQPNQVNDQNIVGEWNEVAFVNSVKEGIFTTAPDRIAAMNFEPMGASAASIIPVSPDEYATKTGSSTTLDIKANGECDMIIKRSVVHGTWQKQGDADCYAMMFEGSPYTAELHDGALVFYLGSKGSPPFEILVR